MAPDPADLDPRAIELPAAQVLEAKISKGAAALGEQVPCVVPSFDPLAATDPMQWRPYVTPAGFFYPKRGNRAIVVVPEGGPPAIVAWWPAADAVPDVSS